MRILLGFIAGILAGILVQAGVIYIASLMFEVPVIRSGTRDEIAQAFASSSTAAFLSSIASYFIGALAAGWIGMAVSRSAAVAWICGGLIALLALVIAVVFPDPAWAQFGSFVAALAGTLIGKHAGDGGEPDTGDTPARVGSDG